MIVEYGHLEKRYARPIADALADNCDFRAWILDRTRFAEFAPTARLLDMEMLAKRSKGVTTWWASHFSEACCCVGCRGQETDLLAIFEAPQAFRFAVHFEVKHPGDRFKEGGTQAAAYPIRAACWVNTPPKRVLRHASATTALLYSSAKTLEYSKHLGCFESKVTFEEIRHNFPGVLTQLDAVS
jgi:hypothetical protein